MLTFRTIQPTNRKQLEEWIAADPDHVARGLKPEFFLPPETEDGAMRYLMEDEQGPIFYVRSENVMRLHIQFAPPSEKRRTAKAIDEFTKLIAAGAQKKHYKQLIFESVVEPLISFLEKRGFHRSPNEIAMDL